MSRPSGAAPPPGWPAEVRAPDAPDWERTAVAWLFDQCPPGYRDHAVLRSHPVVLARFAATAVAAAAAAVDEGLRTVRVELRDRVAPATVEAAVATYEQERRRLRQAGVAVDLVERALRGERWVRRL